MVSAGVERPCIWGGESSLTGRR